MDLSLLVDKNFVNKIILPGAGRKYSGRSSKGLLWLQNSASCFFPNHFIRKASKSVVLYAHGNGGSLGDFKAIVSFYANWFSMSVLAIEYPGYGPAEGEPSEESVNDNLTTAFKFLQSLGYPTSNIILMGYSIGTGPTIELAARLCGSGTPPGTVVTIAAFLSICDIVRDLKDSVIVSMLAETIANRWNSAERVGEITCPILFIHGMKDDVIPWTHSKQLFDKCSAVKKFLRLCANATHKQFEEPADTVETMASFFAESMQADESVTINNVPQFMFVCPHSVIETEKASRSAKRGGSAFSDVSSMYGGTLESACGVTVTDVVSSLTTTTFSFVGQFTYAVGSMFSPTPASASAEPEISTIKPFAQESAGTSADNSEAGITSPSSKLNPDGSSLFLSDDGSDSPVKGAHMEQSLSGRKSVFILPESPTLVTKTASSSSMVDGESAAIIGSVDASVTIPGSKGPGESSTLPARTLLQVSTPQLPTPSPAYIKSPVRQGSRLDEPSARSSSPPPASLSSRNVLGVAGTVIPPPPSVTPVQSRPKLKTSGSARSVTQPDPQQQQVADEEMIALAKTTLMGYYDALNKHDIAMAISYLDGNVLVFYLTESKNYSGIPASVERYKALFNTLPGYKAVVTIQEANIFDGEVALVARCDISCRKTQLRKSTDMVFVIRGNKINMIQHKG